MKHLNLIIFAVVFCVLTACSPKHQTLKNAKKYNFTHTTVETTLFTLTAFTKIRAPSNDIHIYIEGDGLAWRTRSTPSKNPTPHNPVAFKLATADPVKNVLYLARPCQYIDLATQPHCQKKYWTSHRYAPEVISSMNEAIDKIKAQHGFKNIHFIGFSGGAAVSVLLMGQRDDVISLRTIAGNLDHVLLNKTHKVSPLSGSLNPLDTAQKINHIPQYHFIGGKDKTVPLSIAESFIAKAQNTSCIYKFVIPNLTHTKGWLEHWPHLLKKPLNCLKHDQDHNKLRTTTAKTPKKTIDTIP